MSVYFLLLFAPRLGLLCPMGISGDYEETNGRPALSRQTHSLLNFCPCTNTFSNLKFRKYNLIFFTNTHFTLNKFNLLFGRI